MQNDFDHGVPRTSTKATQVRRKARLSTHHSTLFVFFLTLRFRPGVQVKEVAISTIASDAAAAVKGDVVDMDKIKRKLGAMEKERRSAVAYAERIQKQLAAAQQQSVVLQSFLDEREELVKKLREKLKEAGGSETVAD